MHRRRAIVPTLALVSMLVVACGFGGDGSATGSPEALPTATAPDETDSPDATETIDPNLPAKSETDWGPIWNALPPSYPTALEEAGFGGTGIDGPLEDGSFTVWSSTSFGCDTLVTILPRGSESLITVLYGAGCEFD